MTEHADLEFLGGIVPTAGDSRARCRFGCVRLLCGRHGECADGTGSRSGASSQRARPRLKRLLPHMNRIAGALLLLVGASLTYY